MIILSIVAEKIDKIIIFLKKFKIHGHYYIKQSDVIEIKKMIDFLQILKEIYSVSIKMKVSE